MRAAILGARRAAAPLCLVLLCALAASAPRAAAAAEAPTHSMLFSLTGATPPPPGALPPFHNFSPAGSFEDPCGVAVDSDGDLYLADYYHDAVDVYNSAGFFLTQISAEEPLDGPCGLAVSAGGELYVDNWRQQLLRFTPAAFPPQLNTAYGAATVIDSARSTGVALDPAGRVFVDNRSYVAVYEPSGEPVKSAGQPLRIGVDPRASYYGLAVSAFPATEGDLYLADGATDTVRVFDPAGNPIAEIDGAGTPQHGFNSLTDAALAVDPTDGHLFLTDNLQAPFGRPAAVLDEFNPAGAYRGQLPHALLDAEPSGLALDEAGHLYVTSGNTEEGVLYAFGPTADARRLQVSKSGAGEGTVTSEPAGIECGTACVTEHNLGEPIVLSAAPRPHSAFLGWTVDGNPTTCSGTAVCHLTLDENTEVGAEFALIPQQSLEVRVAGSGSGTVTSSPAGISCAATCSGHFDAEGPGATVTLTATPALHSALAAWSNCEALSGPANRQCTVTTSAAKSVEAQFQAVPVHALSVSEAGAGTVTSEPAGILCGATCSAEYDEGTEVVLTATPAAHQAFTGWSGAGCSGTGPCQLTIDQARSTSAAFAPILHTLTLSTAGAGAGSIASAPAGIDCPAACGHQYEEGTQLTLTAHPGPGSAFTGWSGGGCSGNRTCKLTLGADTLLTASFAPYPGEEIAPSPASLTLGRATHRPRATATLAAIVSAPGSLRATGRGLRSAEANATSPGATALRLALSRAGKRALAKANRGRLKIRVTVTFTPADGAEPISATAVVTFRAKRGER